jgi:WD repeat and SOF domain-containing protein 1
MEKRKLTYWECLIIKLTFFVVATCASDRSVILYDTRDTGPVRKVIMRMRCNRLCWNPMEAFIFTCANEDYK